MHFYKPVLIALLFTCSTAKSLATHYYGVDLFYTHVSGNTYRVTLVTYGDCSGSAFPAFATSRPRIHIRKGATEFLADFLEPEPPREGVEVTPVCPDELDNTTCKNPAGSVPGVKKFVYSKEFTLDGPAPDWKFVFLGATDGSTIAGRSNSLTNVSPPGIIRMEATLDNTQFANSSPEYTTIATPFYCINRHVAFNPGAIDADGDSLVYELVPGLDTLNPVAYVSGFSGSNPLAVLPGTFSFSSTTGQLSFTGNQLQKSLVVYRVSEYRNGILLGTSMREMTVVIMNCENNPPLGYITNASGATIVDSVTVRTCRGNQDVIFDIDPVDADNGHKIEMVVKGLPKDAKLDITNNNSTQPKSRFVWNVKGLPEGEHTFFVTYTDDGCPIASKQTQAYTIRIKDDEIFAQATAADCRAKGLFRLTVPEYWSPWKCEIYGDPARVYYFERVLLHSWSDSLRAGKYRLKATSSFGCTAETTVDIPTNCAIADLPNAFSPNGDGKNDILYVRTGEGEVKEMDFRIYNRWGQLVFESHDINKGWDGTYNSDDAPAEAYAYVLFIEFENSQSAQKQGNITLLR